MQSIAKQKGKQENIYTRAKVQKMVKGSSMQKDKRVIIMKI